MSNEEFYKEKERVEKYDDLSKRRGKLVGDRSIILNGLSKITGYYQREVTYDYDYDLKDKLVAAICQVYDTEIESIVNEMKSL